jgi:hypothetical protein
METPDRRGVEWKRRLRGSLREIDRHGPSRGDRLRCFAGAEEHPDRIIRVPRLHPLRQGFGMKGVKEP